MCRMKRFIAAGLLLGSLGVSASTVVYDDIGFTLRMTGEATCLLDVANHTGVVLQEYCAVPVGMSSLFDFRIFSEMASEEMRVDFSSPGFMLFLR